jgi:RNA polymerase sigma-32 factor
MATSDPNPKGTSKSDDEAQAEPAELTPDEIIVEPSDDEQANDAEGVVLDVTPDSSRPVATPRSTPRPKPIPTKPISKPISKPIPKAKGKNLEPTTALSAYMSQLGEHAPISREEEHELAVKWVEEGDVEAARKMVLSNLRLVVKIAMEYRRAWTNTLDLIQEGNVGLMEAVQRYDPYQGVKLSSYAVYWIRAFILKYILDNMRSVRMGTTRASRKLFFRLNKEKRELERQGFEVTPMLLAERLEVPESEVVDMEARLARPDISMSAPLSRDDSGGASYGDMMAAGGESAETQVGQLEMHRVFRDAIDEFSEQLGERDLRILNERVLADEPRTLAEMGEEFGVSRERVRQLEARMIKQLREFMQENLVDFELYTPEGEE